MRYIRQNGQKYIRELTAMHESNSGNLGEARTFTIMVVKIMYHLMNVGLGKYKAYRAISEEVIS